MSNDIGHRESSLPWLARIPAVRVQYLVRTYREIRSLHSTQRVEVCNRAAWRRIESGDAGKQTSDPLPVGPSPAISDRTWQSPGAPWSAARTRPRRLTRREDLTRWTYQSQRLYQRSRCRRDVSGLPVRGRRARVRRRGQLAT
jgi:hypothetical protein